MKSPGYLKMVASMLGDKSQMHATDNKEVPGCEVTVPESYNYIGIFMTFRCPYSCSFCINRFSQANNYRGT
jgi:predicted DNA-binding helix-hairpin-helix protein